MIFENKDGKVYDVDAEITYVCNDKKCYMTIELDGKHFMYGDDSDSRRRFFDYLEFRK